MTLFPSYYVWLGTGCLAVTINWSLAVLPGFTQKTQCWPTWEKLWQLCWGMQTNALRWVGTVSLPSILRIEMEVHWSQWTPPPPNGGFLHRTIGYYLDPGGGGGQKVDLELRLDPRWGHSKYPTILYPNATEVGLALHYAQSGNCHFVAGCKWCSLEFWEK